MSFSLTALRHAARTLLIASAACAVFAADLAAQTLTEREAHQQVASPRGTKVILADLGVSDKDLLSQLEAQARKFPYYGAFVTSPGDPAQNQSALGIGNFHSPEDAVRVALGLCEARRTSGAPCIVVAQTVPRSYKPGVLTLSAEATESLRGAFRRLDSPKAFAISAETGHYGFARGDGTRALADCNAGATKSGETDCRLVVVD